MFFLNCSIFLHSFYNILGLKIDLLEFLEYIFKVFLSENKLKIKFFFLGTLNLTFELDDDMLSLQANNTLSVHLKK